MKIISDIEAIVLHRLLAAYHAKIARDSRIALKHDHHDKLAEQLEHEATFIEDFLVFCNEMNQGLQ
jgi:hypothetical protein